ncbi:two-component sensor histidine kinase [Breoghania corrubedonensis]|uniref:histidine kinase n=1 Tax=Breoghania corrubedonensis TaxID=665038 RepID=A0A2T5VGR0_9HYPH|nr:histidine kinase dimerization/phosphoacceptor domain -containing protein [Breoghania corrubedonensis]PTW62942.1 two-component sensor histidine kinase [Breoghania corrubedonensis]
MPWAKLPTTSSKIDRRLFGYIAGALVPLAALAFAFSYADHVRRADTERSDFIDYARLIGQSSAKIIARAEGFAAGLTAREDASAVDCDAVFGALQGELRQAMSIRVAVGGEQVCARVRFREGDTVSSVLKEIRESEHQAIVVTRTSDDDRVSVSIGLRPRAVLTAPIAATTSSHASFALLSPDGSVLADYSDRQEEKADFLKLLDDGDFSAAAPSRGVRASDGWLIAVVPITGTDFRIATGVLPPQAAFEPWLSVAKALLLPVTLLAAVFVVLRFGVQRFLLSYLRHIYGTFRQYGAGDTDARVGRLERAPAEIQLLGMTFDMMADRIAYRTRDLENSLAEQQRLTRELHHRIKNTLQMIASLLGMQRREAKRASDKAVLRVALERVQGISAAFRVSYATNEGTDVGLEDLVREVVDALREPCRLTASRVRFSVDDPHRTTIVLDKAIPLAFILAELLPPRFDVLLPGEAVSVSIVGGQIARLHISGPPGYAEVTYGDPESPLTTRLMRAYLGQLSADFEVEGTATTLLIPVKDAAAPERAPFAHTPPRPSPTTTVVR